MKWATYQSIFVQTDEHESFSEARRALEDNQAVIMLAPKYPLPTEATLKSAHPAKSTSELAKLLYPDTTFDCALPQEWVDEMRGTHGFDVRGAFVWGYSEELGSAGIPLPLTLEALHSYLNSRRRHSP